MKKIVLTFGLIAGGIMSLMFALTIPFHDEIGFDRGVVIGYTSMVLAFLLVFFGIRTYRDNIAGGSVGFGQALKVGSLIVLVASVTYVMAWQVIYYGGIMPDYMTKYTAHVIDKERAKGASEAELAKKATEMQEFEEMYKNPLVNFGLTILEPLPVGLIITLVSAAVLRRKSTA